MFNTVLNTASLIYQVCPSSTRVVENPSNSINHNSEKFISRAENLQKFWKSVRKPYILKVCDKFTVDQLFENRNFLITGR